MIFGIVSSRGVFADDQKLKPNGTCFRKILKFQVMYFVQHLKVVDVKDPSLPIVLSPSFFLVSCIACHVYLERVL